MDITKEMREYYSKLGYTDDEIKQIRFKDFIGEVKEIDKDARTLVAVISDDTRDRTDEVMLPEGADLRRYRQNPVVLWAHNYRQPPIAKTLWIRRDGNAIIAKPHFADTQFAGEVNYLYQNGYLKAFSIGFIGKEWVDGDGTKKPRRTYTKWELVEYSAVPVPANPNALVHALKSVKSDILRKELQIEKWGQDVYDAIENGKDIIDEIEIKPAPDVTENYIRWRIRNPDLFKKMRTMTFSAKEGIKAIVGRLKQDDGKTHVQAVLFDKKKWTVEKARKWIKEHKDSLKDATISIKISDIEIDEGNAREGSLERLEALEGELETTKAQYEDSINDYKKEIADLKYTLYVLLAKLEYQPDTVSEMTEDAIVKTIDDSVVRVIRQVTGKV